MFLKHTVAPPSCGMYDWNILEKKSLQTLMKHELLKSTKIYKLKFCEHCVVGKKTIVKFGMANHDTHDILKYVYSDVWRLTKIASISGSHYFVSFINDFYKCV